MSALFDFLGQLAGAGLPIGGALAGGATQGIQNRAALDQLYADMELRRQANARAQAEEERAATLFAEEGDEVPYGLQPELKSAYPDVQFGPEVSQRVARRFGIQAIPRYKQEAGALRAGGQADRTLQTLFNNLTELSTQLQVEDPKLAILMEQGRFDVLTSSRNPTAQALLAVMNELQKRGVSFPALQGANTGAIAPPPLPQGKPRAGATPAPAPAGGLPPQVEAAAQGIKTRRDWEALKAQHPGWAAQIAAAKRIKLSSLPE